MVRAACAPVSCETPEVDGYEQYLARLRLDLLAQPAQPSAAGPGIAYTPGTPFYLTEREVTPIGVTVRKYFRRTRSPDGTTFAWADRMTTPAAA